MLLAQYKLYETSLSMTEMLDEEDYIHNDDYDDDDDDDTAMHTAYSLGGATTTITATLPIPSGQFAAQPSESILQPRLGKAPRVLFLLLLGRVYSVQCRACSMKIGKGQVFKRLLHM